MRNLLAAIYREHELYLIQCETSQESLKLEKYLKKELRHKHIRGEWFASVKPECVQSLLVGDFAHMLLVPHKADTYKIPESKDKRVKFDVLLN